MKHMNRRILAVALAAVMVLGLLPTAFASAEEPEEQTPVQEVAQPAAQAGAGSEISTQAATTVSTWADLQAAFKNGGDYILANDVTAGDSDGGLWVQDNATVNLDLNGHTINKNKRFVPTPVINIYTGSTVTFSNSSAEKLGKITGGDNFEYTGGVDMSNATLTMTGISISGNRAYKGSNTGGLRVDYSGNTTMNGGSISDNESDKNCGGVWVSDEATFTMNGVTVSGNTTTGAGGGVFMEEHGILIMNGGTITNNTAGTKGGGIYMEKDSGAVILGGDAVIADNKLADGTEQNVYLSSGVSMQLNAENPLTSTAKIGVTVEDAVTAEGVLVATATDGKAANYVKNFFYDDADAGYIFGVKNGDPNHIYVAIKGSADVTEPEMLNVTITPGANMTASGDLEQSVAAGEAMKPVVFTADDGYWFSENYAGFETVARALTDSGLTVERNSDTQITVSGTPTGDVNLTLAAAAEAPAKFVDAQGNVIDNPESYVKGETANAEGDIFDGWRGNDGTWLTSAADAKAGVTYTASWRLPDPKFTDGGKVIDNPASYKKGETANAAGQLFDGWFDESGNELTDVEKARNGVTYTAHWKAADNAAAPKTGDAGVMLYVGLASAALLSAGAAVLLTNRKRREN